MAGNVRSLFVDSRIGDFAEVLDEGEEAIVLIPQIGIIVQVLVHAIAAQADKRIGMLVAVQVDEDDTAHLLLIGRRTGQGSKERQPTKALAPRLVTVEGIEMAVRLLQF